MTGLIKLPAPLRSAAIGQRSGEAASQACRDCDVKLTICSFNVRSNGKRSTQCRACASEASRKHYEANQDKVKAASRLSGPRSARRNRQWLRSFLADKVCMDCAESCADIMEFDHRRSVKRRTVSELVHSGASIKSIKAEIAKCDLLCPNCHRRRSAQDQNNYLWTHLAGATWPEPASWVSPAGSPNERIMRSQMRRAQRNQADSIAYLQEHPCVDCSCEDILVLEYDHVRGDKHAELWKLISKGSSLARLHAERAKCEIRCANCHRRKSHNVRAV